ncbi:hypothetical protein Ccar_02630 [Clostridium carboxidivorans P7]|uniref:DUF5667 domain-containing protein n=1 Tax=Clostridium carboxidivorans P7 TaxID=536227 RepID=C6Q2I9_9CLOT|nr:DUF5667 domain-containing protein [Clostridium carboxidivorans]AKN29801.1 hypothetical protein Ccar_02630 [Clostridium carboxidivorans P7]EET84292.1 conserved hypothetical protein [Clostridium carboxidivorans P7]
MKKIALFVTALAVSLSIGGGVALADASTATFTDKAGITPDNTVLYSIDKNLDNLKISMASGDDKKAEALADVAEERLGESELMTDKKNTVLSSKTLNEYNDKITEAQDKIDDAVDKVSTNTTDDADKLEKLEKLKTSITNTQMKSIEVLKSIENKVSGNAKVTLAQVIEMQTRKKEAIIAAAKEKQILLQAKKAVKEAETKLEQAKKAGDEQAIKTAEDTLKQAQTALASENEKFTKAIAAKKEAMKGGVGQLKKQAKKDQPKDTTNSTTNNTTSGDTNTTPEPTTTNENTNTTNTTDNTTNTTTQGAVDNNTTVTTTDAKATTSTETNVKSKENNGQEIKNNKENNVKENQGHNKENNSANKHNSNH